MLPEKLREYFSFSKKERTGILVLITLIIIVFILPYFFSAKKTASNKQQFEQFKNEIAQLKTQQDSDHTRSKYYAQDEKTDDAYYTPSNKNTNATAGTLFYFDPNTATNDDWKKLGVRDKTIQTIGHYISKGGKFHKPEDLKKIYGLSEEKFDQLLPYVKFKNTETIATDKKADDKYYTPSRNNTIATTGTLFYFDPNTATNDDWKKLGVRDKTIQTIGHYLSKGGKFHKPEDLKKIYGLSEEKFDQLLPYVKFKNADTVATYKKTETNYVAASSFKKGKTYSTININTADTSAFSTLPGIGSKLSNRIITFREKLGGFYSASQIAEVYGMPDSVFLKIKPYLIVGDVPLKKINVNTADANLLKQHPYIKWNLANAIVQYRQQHGDFKKLDELHNIALITPEVFAKISPYLEIK